MLRGDCGESKAWEGPLGRLVVPCVDLLGPGAPAKRGRVKGAVLAQE